MKIKYLLFLLASSILLSETNQLSSGFYFGNYKKDTINVSVDSDKINLELSNGSKLTFNKDGSS